LKTIFDKELKTTKIVFQCRGREKQQKFPILKATPLREGTTMFFSTLDKYFSHDAF
jgi:hypothetical protein